MQKLPRRFYNRDPVTVAQELLGMNLVHVSRGVRRVGRIVEVESYLGPRDLASHSSKGRTARTVRGPQRDAILVRDSDGSDRKIVCE